MPEKPGFVHLHTHTHYSLLDGAARIEPLLKRTLELGMTSLAITDHGAMYGVIEFYETAKKLGVKPILGVEAYMAPRGRHDREAKLDSKAYHQLLLAETFEGYKNLVKLTSEAYINGFYYKPRIDKVLLRQHSRGLIATSGCFNGEIPRKLETSFEDGKKALEEYLDIFGPDNFFIELQNRPEYPDSKKIDEMLIRLSKEYKLGLICTNDVHYISKDDAEAQDILVCVGSGKTVNDPNRLNMTTSDLHLASPEEMAEKFPHLPEALENTLKIAERCTVEIPMDENILPSYPLPKGTTDRMYLRQLCEEGIKRRYGFTYTITAPHEEGELLPSPMNDPALPLEERVQARVEYELSVIEKMGYESYFLIVQDFIMWAKSQNIMIGPGRGSAAGSLVSYLTGIINLDPLKYNLIFERFLNPERIGMPDIDNDIEDARRDEVIQYVRDRYGADKVAQIITFGTMAARNAIRDVGRVLGVSYNECDYLAKLIPSGPGGLTISQALDQIDDLKNLYSSNDQLRHLLDIASKLEGVARHTSIHAAGVVITKEPITEYAPLQRAVKDDNAIVTQYAMKEVEHIGLLKIDFLGLSNLNIIQQALRIIRKTRNTEIDLDTLPIDDVPSYELLARAETTGVFQLESSGMKRYLKELKPTTFEDILSMVALYRPGPMDAIPDFIEAKHGRKEITYLHPILEPILAFTYGVIVTQDQVLEIARKFAGFSYAEADILRKAVGKKIKKLLDEQREKFINGAVRTNQSQGVTLKLAEQVWDFIEPFARYGFNRAHAACYAMIAYQTAYLKAHYPVEFMAALLTSDIHNLDRVGIEIAECRERDIEVLPPDVNESFVEFGTVFYEKEGRDRQGRDHDAYIRFGLGAIKNVGIQPGEAIVEERKRNGKFATFTDFVTRNSSSLNKKVLENLAMAGALDSLIERQCVLHNMDKVLAFLGYINKHQNTSQINLFDEAVDEAASFKLELETCEPAPSKVRLAWERDLLGIYLSEHPLQPVIDLLPSDRMPLRELSQQSEGSRVKIAGCVMSLHTILTKNGQAMAFVILEDDTGNTELIAFPKVWKEKEKVLVPGNPIVVEGKVSRKDSGGGEGLMAKVLVDTCFEVTADLRKRPRSATKVTLAIPSDGNRTLLTSIKTKLEEHPGNLPVTLLIPTTEGDQPLNIQHKVEYCEQLHGKLSNLIGPENITWS